MRVIVFTCKILDRDISLNTIEFQLLFKKVFDELTIIYYE